jgi:hypothetical protein
MDAEPQLQTSQESSQLSPIFLAFGATEASLWAFVQISFERKRGRRRGEKKEKT